RNCCRAISSRVGGSRRGRVLGPYFWNRVAASSGVRPFSVAESCSNASGMESACQEGEGGNSDKSMILGRCEIDESRLPPEHVHVVKGQDETSYCAGKANGMGGAASG